jgi:hypothetical protein
MPWLFPNLAIQSCVENLSDAAQIFDPVSLEPFVQFIVYSITTTVFATPL